MFETFDPLKFVKFNFYQRQNNIFKIDSFFKNILNNFKLDV